MLLYTFKQYFGVSDTRILGKKRKITENRLF